MSEEIKNIQEELNEQMQIRRDKLAEYEADGIYPFGQRFVVKDYAKDIKEDFFLKYDGQPVVIAGRLMTIRSHGKTAFANIRDKSGDIQVYFRKDVLGEEAYKYVKMLDIGDIIGVEGHVFKTHTGEVTIKVNKLTLLSKSLRPLPEKWHGLKDTELRYRQRYVDLIVNPEVRDTFVKRSQIVAKIREYMSQLIFKIENPVWQRIVRKLYTKYDKEFYSYPAAKTNHHAFETGLAYHTATMVRLADAISEIYPQLNKSLLYAGIMLHDLAKVIELTGPDQTEYTVRGNLLGHIALIDSEITKTVMELGIDDTKEEVVLLRHVILSHHGLLEYGSPVRPRIMEAEIIHMIDNLDASMMMMSTALALVDKGEMTNKIFAMDNRSFYKPDLD